MTGIFISYRERDSKAWALSLRDRLVEEFGEDRVFLDKDTLKAGKWKDQIERALGDCNIVLVVIGRGWLGAQDEEGHKRLMSDDDVHRREIALALARPEVTVIPVVVDGATMPKPDELPENIRDLIQQQSRSISDNAAHRKVDLDALSADIRRVGHFPPKPDSTPTPIVTVRKHSGKVIGALCLVVLIFAAASEGLDHDEKIGGIFFGGLALWLAWSGFKDIKAGLAKGKGLGMAALGLSGFVTLGMLGALTQPDAPSAPVVNNMAPQPMPMSPVVTQTQPAPQTQAAITPEAIVPVAKPQKAAKSQKATPIATLDAANFQGIWQDGRDLSIFYLIRQENDLVHLQEYNALGAMTFESTGRPVGNELKIDHPMLVANLAMSDGGQQMGGSVTQRATGMTKPMLLRKVDLNAIDPQIAALLRPLVE